MSPPPPCPSHTLTPYTPHSVESLPGHLKQYFEILVTVDYDTHITRQALDTIWGTEIFDTEDYMRGMALCTVEVEGHLLISL